MNCCTTCNFVRCSFNLWARNHSDELWSNHQFFFLSNFNQCNFFVVKFLWPTILTHIQCDLCQLMFCSVEA